MAPCVLGTVSPNLEALKVAAKLDLHPEYHNSANQRPSHLRSTLWLNHTASANSTTTRRSTYSRDHLKVYPWQYQHIPWTDTLCPEPRYSQMSAKWCPTCLGTPRDCQQWSRHPESAQDAEAHRRPSRRLRHHKDPAEDQGYNKLQTNRPCSWHSPAIPNCVCPNAWTPICHLCLPMAYRETSTYDRGTNPTSTWSCRRRGPELPEALPGNPMFKYPFNLSQGVWGRRAPPCTLSFPISIALVLPLIYSPNYPPYHFPHIPKQVPK